MEQKFTLAIVGENVIENIVVAPLSFKLADKELVPLARMAKDESVEEVLIETPKGFPKIGWVLSDNTFSPPPTYASDLVAYAANLRWLAEVSGTEVAGVVYQTSRFRRATLQAMLQNIDFAGTDINFKLNGKFIVVSKSEVRDELQIITGHVQACFDAEYEAINKIELGVITTKAELEAMFIPLVLDRNKGKK